MCKEPCSAGQQGRCSASGSVRHLRQLEGATRLCPGCRTYNDPHSAIVAECNQLASYFEGMWRKLDFGAQQQQQQQAAAGAQAGPLGEALSFRRQLQQHVAAEQGAQQALPLGQQGSLGGSLEGGALSPRSSMQVTRGGAGWAPCHDLSCGSKGSLHKRGSTRRCILGSVAVGKVSSPVAAAGARQAQAAGGGGGRGGGGGGGQQERTAGGAPPQALPYRARPATAATGGAAVPGAGKLVKPCSSPCRHELLAGRMQ